MKQAFGLSWDHGKKKLIAAVALLLIAITMALTPAASTQEAKQWTPEPVEVGVTVQIQSTSFSFRGSTWG